MPEETPISLAWTCATCGKQVTDPDEVHCQRGHYWHWPCFRDVFPAPGELCPSTLSPYALDPFTGVLALPA